jgi:hypothetical protein
LYSSHTTRRTAEVAAGVDPPASYYSADYFAARRRFVAAARRLGWVHHSLPIDAPSPTGEPLSIDVAVAGSRSPRSAVVVSSGVHGVEGFFGSAVQLAFLDRLPPDWQPPDGAALVMIHALNPFGFAWRRRFNEENVDLNRNFLLAGEEYAGSPPLCETFRRVMLKIGARRRFDFSTARMALLAMRHGLRSFWETLPVGQYDFPDGLFFGGHRRSQSAQAVDALMPKLLNGASETVHLDFHTGLGRWNRYQLLMSEAGEPEHAGWWRAHFGAHHVKEPARVAGSYQVRGGLGRWLRAHVPNCRYRFATAEFGTYSPARVIQALVRELGWHAQLGTEAPDHWSRRELSDVFVPRSIRWRTNALERGLSLIRQATDVLWRQTTSRTPASAASPIC